MNEQEEHREQLSAYVDGELPHEQARRVEEAVRWDPGLAEELAQIRATRELLRGLPRTAAPEGFARRVISRAERRRLLGAPAGGPIRSARWITVAAAAVVLLSVAAALLLLTSSQMPPAGTPTATPGTATSQPPGPIAAAPERHDGPARREPLGRTAGPGKGAKGLLRKRHGEGGRTGKSVLDTRDKDRHRPSAPHPAGRKVRGVAGEIVAFAEAFSINTDDLDASRREVERLLCANGLLAESPTRTKDEGLRVQYVILDATPDQLAKVRDGLGAVRARQRVPQEPVAYEEMVQLAAAARRSAGDRRPGGRATPSGRGPATPKPPLPKRPSPPATKAEPPTAPPARREPLGRAAPPRPGPGGLLGPKPAVPTREPSGGAGDAARSMSKPDTRELPTAPPSRASGPNGGVDRPRARAAKKPPPKAQPPGRRIAPAGADSSAQPAKEAPGPTEAKRAPAKPPAEPVQPTEPAPTAKLSSTAPRGGRPDAEKPGPSEVKGKQADTETRREKAAGEGERTPPKPIAADRRAWPHFRAAPKMPPGIKWGSSPEGKPETAATSPADPTEAGRPLDDKARRAPGLRTRIAAAGLKDDDLRRPVGPTTRAGALSAGRAKGPADPSRASGPNGNRAQQRQRGGAVLITLNKLPTDVAALRAALSEAAQTQTRPTASREALRGRTEQAPPKKGVAARK